MIYGMQFAYLRLIIIALGVLAQAYIFFAVCQFIKSSGRPDRFKRLAMAVTGATISVLFALNGYILFKPIPWVNPPWPIQVFLFYPPAVWSLGSIFSAFFLLFALTLGRLADVIIRLSRRLAGEKAPNPANPDRRRFLQRSALGVAAAPLALSGYGVAYISRAVPIQELSLPFGRSLRVVQITDIHAGIYITQREVRRFSDQIMALKPDLFVLTGDLISNSLSFLPGCLEEMARVSARYGTFATLGNHEHRNGHLSELRKIFRQYRIPLLNNANQMVQTEQGPFAVAGIDDLRIGHPDLEATLRGLNPAIPTLLLSHRPEIFPRAAARKVPLTLAGHYHGGQIKLSLPGGDISLAHLRSSYTEGLYRIEDSRMYVSRGIGTTFTPVRFNAPPEITLFHLT